MSLKVDQQLLERFFHSQCSAWESELVSKWLAEPGNEEAAKHMMKMQWDNSQSLLALNEPDLLALYGKIQSKIHTGDPALSHQSFNKTAENSTFEPTSLITGKQPFLRQYAGIAAGLVILILSGIAFYFIQNREPAYISYKNPSGKIAAFSLPDGTKVSLNANTILRYPEHFDRQENRQVYLDGEGYFDVTENKSQPFIVTTSSVTIRVLGTAFNVKDYKEDNNIETTLIRGKVTVNNNSGAVSETVELKPNQQAIFSRQSKKLSTLEVASEHYTTWRDGELKFQHEPLDNVIKTLERWYGVKIHLEDSKTTCRVTAKIEKESLNEMLEVFKVISGINYTLKGNEVWITGSLCDN